MKKIFAALVIALSAFELSAQNMPSLVIGADPVSTAVAGTSIARPTTAFAAENNAAFMTLDSKTMAVSASYTMWAPNSADNTLIGFGGYYKVNDKFAVGLSAKYFQDPEYAVANATGSVTGTYAPTDIVAGVGFSYKIMDGLSAGLTAKMIRSSIAEDANGMAFGADVTLAYKKDALSAGLGVCNLGSSIDYGGADSYSMPMMVRAGAAYDVMGFLTASAELGYFLNGGAMAGLGAEYSFKDIAFVRAGYHYGTDGETIPQYLSLGAGFKYAGVELNATFLTASETLGSTLMFGLGYSF